MKNRNRIYECLRSLFKSSSNPPEAKKSERSITPGIEVVMLKDALPLSMAEFSSGPTPVSGQRLTVRSMSQRQDGILLVVLETEGMPSYNLVVGREEIKDYLRPV